MREVYHWIRTYEADYLLVLLGFNDLGWFVSGPEGLIMDMGTLVKNAREANPKINILVGNVVHRTHINGRDDLPVKTDRYNQILREHLPTWFDWNSPIRYVDVAGLYNCHPNSCPDGYDGLHPNAFGEWAIAKAFADVLQHDFHFHGEPLNIPSRVDTRPVSAPLGVKIVPRPEGLLTTWDTVKNARGYEIRTRLEGAQEWWSSGEVYPKTTASFNTWVLNGQTWEVQVRTKGDNDDRSEWSLSRTATVAALTAPPPANIIVNPEGGDGVVVTWDSVTGYDVDRYSIYLWDRDTEGSWTGVYPSRGTRWSIGGLVPGHRYSVWVATHATIPHGTLSNVPEAPGGLPGTGRDVYIGGGRPPQPSSFTSESIDATTIRLNWNHAGGISGYAIYSRNIHDGQGLKLDGTTTDASYLLGIQFPGIWNFEYCVAAFNGNLESTRVCTIPAVCCGHSKRDLVTGNVTVPAGFVDTAHVTAQVQHAVLGQVHDMYMKLSAGLGTMMGNFSTLGVPPPY